MRQLPSADIRSQDYKVGARMISLGLDQASCSDILTRVTELVLVELMDLRVCKKES